MKGSCTWSLLLRRWCVGREHTSCSDLCSNQHCVSDFECKWEMLRSTLKTEAQLWILVLQQRILAFSAADLSALQLPNTSLRRLINICMLIHVFSELATTLSSARPEGMFPAVAVSSLPGCGSGQSPGPAAPQPHTPEIAQKHSDFTPSTQHSPKTAGW